VDASSKNRIRVGSVVEHGPAVLKRRLVNLIMSDQLSPRDAIVWFAHALVVTKDGALASQPVFY
jgi:hypothetical protein